MNTDQVLQAVEPRLAGTKKSTRRNLLDNALADTHGILLTHAEPVAKTAVQS
jgi:hypothetical protein